MPKKKWGQNFLVRPEIAQKYGFSTDVIVSVKSSAQRVIRPQVTRSRRTMRRARLRPVVSAAAPAEKASCCQASRSILNELSA